MSKNKIIILSEGDYTDSQPKFAHATGQTGKDFVFNFVSVKNGRYCDALLEIKEIIDTQKCYEVYVVTNKETSKRFLPKLRRNINQSLNTDHFNKIVSVKSFHIDLKKGTKKISLLITFAIKNLL